MPTAAALFNNVTLLKSYSSTESFANEEYSLQFKPFSSETCANDGSTSTTKSSGLTVQLYHYQRANEVDTKSTASTTDVQGGGALKLVVLKDSKTTILESILLASTPICKINTVLTIITLAEGPVAFKFSSSTDLHQFNDFLQAHVFSQNTSSSSASSASSSSTSSTVAVETSHFEQKTDKSSSSQYFGYYGQLTQQQNMLQDYTRTGTYQRAMLENSIDFEGKIVVDVGAGTGVLSFFAIQAGAAKVYAIEASAMAENTRLLVEKNGLKDRIIVINSKVEEVELPEKVDLIISEPMGTMLVNERMLESYIYARKWLKSNPHMELKEKEKEKEREKEKEKEKEKQSEKEKEKQDNEEGETDKSSQNNVASISPSPMFPSMAYMYCAPFTDEFLFMEQFSKVTFWFQHSFYGIDMTSLQARAMEEIFSQPVVDCIDPSILGASPICKVFNFATVSEEELCTIHLPFEFVYSAPATVHGLAFWFDVSFNGSYSTVWLSTSPMAPLTHWYQLRCLVSQPLQITRGQTLKGTVTLKANSRQSYDIDLEMQVKGLPLVVRNKVNLKEPLYRYTGVTQSSVVAQSSTMASNAANYALNGGSSSSSGDNHNGNNSNSNSDFRNMNYNDYNSYDGQFDNAYEDSATPSTNSAQ